MVSFRFASEHDVEGVAALHADSWRRHYRGALLDSFLDGDVYADRLGAWRGRLTQRDPARFTIVAELNGEVAGFVHVILDEDARWGALLDNLHVDRRVKRQGIGRRLMAEAARELAQRRPHDSRFYLWVLAQNTAAQAFYAACGGAQVETVLHGPLPGGGWAPCHRIAWPSAAELRITGGGKSPT